MQQVSFSDQEVRSSFFQHPFRALAIAPSMMGKSEWAYSFIREIDQITDTKFDSIKYYYTVYNKKFARLLSAHPNVTIEQGAPLGEIKEILSPDNVNIERKPSLWVLDDMQECFLSSSGETLSQLYTKGYYKQCLSVFICLSITSVIFSVSHNCGISVLSLIQQLYHSGSSHNYLRTISLNSR